jgi:uncharacterized protein involved in response to NO
LAGRCFDRGTGFRHPEDHNAIEIGGGTMTLAVMTRATLGHTGQALQASIGTQCLYAAVIAAALMRVCASIGVEHMHVLLTAAGTGWTTAFPRLFSLVRPHALLAAPVLTP